MRRLPLEIYRRDSTDTAIAASGTASDTPDMVPAAGAKKIGVVMRGPSGTCTLNVSGFNQSGTAVQLASFEATGAAGYVNDFVNLQGWEYVKLALVNGSAEQSPEVLVTLYPDDD